MTATTSTTSLAESNDSYISRSDEAEFKRLVDLSKVNGLGEPYFQDDEEVVQLMEDFGLGFSIDKEVGEK